MPNTASQHVPTAGVIDGRRGLQGRRVGGDHIARWGLPRGLPGSLLGLLGLQELFVAVNRPLGRLLRLLGPGRCHKLARSRVCGRAGSHNAPQGELQAAGNDVRVRWEHGDDSKSAKEHRKLMGSPGRSIPSTIAPACTGPLYFNEASAIGTYFFAPRTSGLRAAAHRGCGAAHESRAARMPAWWKLAWMSAWVARLSFEQPT